MDLVDVIAQRRGGDVSLSTIYRTLKDLKRHRLVDERLLSEEHHRYERRTGARHLHVVCTPGGAVAEFSGSATDCLRGQARPESHFEATSLALEFAGPRASVPPAVPVGVAEGGALDPGAGGGVARLWNGARRAVSALDGDAGDAEHVAAENLLDVLVRAAALHEGHREQRPVGPRHRLGLPRPAAAGRLFGVLRRPEALPAGAGARPRKRIVPIVRGASGMAPALI